MTYFRELLATRELLWNLTGREVKGKYRRTVFGQLWSLINPVATMLVYTVVFSFILRAQPPAGEPSNLDIYPLWLLCGLLPWLYFARVVEGALASVVTHAGLITKVYFPRMHLPLAVTLSTAFTWAIELGTLVLALAIFGAFVWPWIPLVLVFMVLLALFATGLGLLLAIVNVHFRDTQHFTTLILQMWLYLTPIIYPISFVERAAATTGDWLLIIYRLNPMERFVAVFRQLLYDNRWPDPIDAAWCLGWAALVFGAGYLVFARHERRLAELL